MQMFIAVINENFDVAEESKRSRQASHYWASHRPQQARAAWVRKLNPYRWLKAQPKAIEVELPSNLVLPMQKALVQDYSLPKRSNSGLVGATVPMKRRGIKCPPRSRPQGGAARLANTLRSRHSDVCSVCSRAMLSLGTCP